MNNENNNENNNKDTNTTNNNNGKTPFIFWCEMNNGNEEDVENESDNRQSSIHEDTTISNPSSHVFFALPLIPEPEERESDRIDPFYVYNTLFGAGGTSHGTETQNNTENNNNRLLQIESTLNQYNNNSPFFQIESMSSNEILSNSNPLIESLTSSEGIRELINSLSNSELSFFANMGSFILNSLQSENKEQINSEEQKAQLEDYVITETCCCDICFEEFEANKMACKTTCCKNKVMHHKCAVLSLSRKQCCPFCRNKTITF
jgi:hypothetical protein